MSTTDLGSSEDLVDVAHSEDLDHEVLGDHTVAIERNPEQSLVLLETEHASAAIAIDVSCLTLAEVLEETDVLVEELENLATDPVFAMDGGDRDV